MGFLKTLTIGAVGYVLGARAGRGRYEQIKANTQKLWDSSKVREGRSKVQPGCGDIPAGSECGISQIPRSERCCEGQGK